jgi:hypothetical protein
VNIKFSGLDTIAGNGVGVGLSPLTALQLASPSAITNNRQNELQAWNGLITGFFLFLWNYSGVMIYIRGMEIR